MDVVSILGSFDGSAGFCLFGEYASDMVSKLLMRMEHRMRKPKKELT